MKTQHTFIITLAIIALTIFSSCKKYLDVKPDTSLVIPQTLNDCRLILDDYSIMNSTYPSEGELAADNYYYNDVDYNAILDPEIKNNYIWAPEAQHNSQWSGPYQIIYRTNLVLQVLGKLPNSGEEYNNLKGTAFFFRAFAYYHLAQLFIKPFDATTAATDLGLPIRLNPEVDDKIQRANVQQTYNQILGDLNTAVDLLPKNTSIQSRPNKATAYGALARIYLAMQDYTNAGKMANEALTLYSTLMDYKTLTRINLFNPEVIFQAITLPSVSFGPTVVKVDNDLYNSYQSNDKRKTLFFRAFGNGFAFIGSYNGVANSVLFTGIATDELYLIRAECRARTGNSIAAMDDLNTLLRNRYDNTFINLTAANADDALVKILTERRKELVFRNHRWTDLRRLNKDPRFAITLRRTKNNISYTPLEPNDLRYTLLIPYTQEINLSGIAQNPR
ncbi:RagB/SusD family nutrient uptake outer membrane protein [Pedobacter gandavensis]|uniref:RagB/SusD family nutrient uptake outer membrane protein n=1 Tax=Pedobacter gandavensis TaxID=2679963 RepID=UPI00247A4D96|nr:RagB/SusD family nutrient uptake outer membrane protein [Pedobacter gandavensis]WGQ11543.1 RagB/SusD family nutrient uptake outer membrane protein [Pedobacter gandavensis]